MPSKTRTALVSSLALAAVLATGAFAGVPAPVTTPAAKAATTQNAPIQGAVAIAGSPSVGGSINAVLIGPAATVAQQPGASVQYAWVLPNGSGGTYVRNAPGVLVQRQMAGAVVFLQATVSAPGYAPKTFTAGVSIAPMPSNVRVAQVVPQGAQRLLFAQPDTSGYASGTSFRWEWYRNGQLVQVTSGPQAVFPSSQPSGTEYRVVQVAWGSFPGEHRLNPTNRVVVQNGQWVPVSL